MAGFDEVLAAAQGLNTVERLRLADAIWQEVLPTDWPLPSPEWIAEVQARSTSYDSGNIVAANWDDVRIRARRSAGLDD